MDTQKYLKDLQNKLSQKKAPSFETTLSEEEKIKLAKLILKKAEKELLVWDQNAEDRFIRLILSAESLAPSHPELLFLLARCFFRCSAHSHKKQYLFFALEKLQKMGTSFIEDNGIAWQLWGNVLLALAAVCDESAYVEEAIEKYEEGLKILAKQELKETVEIQAQFYWDLGRAWSVLAQNSEEVCDLKKALNAFKKSEGLGTNNPYFWIDFGGAHLACAKFLGSLEHVHAAISFFQKAILTSSKAEKGESYQEAWKCFAKARSNLALLTGDEGHFKKASSTFQEAILACPQICDLWLDWARLHARFGVLVHEISHLETALDKLASTKITECSETAVLVLVAEVLGALGLFLDKHTLLKEAGARLKSALKCSPRDSSVITGWGKFLLYQGLYFDDERYFPKAVQKFKKTLHNTSFDSDAWEGLFRAYLAWGEKEGNPYLIQKAINASKRMNELRPFCPYTYAETAMAYLKLWTTFKEKGADALKEKILLQAIFFFEEAIRLKGGLENSYSFEWVYHLGGTCDLLGDLTGEEKHYEKAVRLLQRLYERAPHFMEVTHLLASALSHYGELVTNVESLYQAIDLFDGILKQDGEDDNVWTERGYAFLILSEISSDPMHPEKSKEFLSRAERDLLMGAKLGNADAFYHLACLYSLAGLFESSVEYLHKAENLGSMPDLGSLEHDEWLEGVRQTIPFQEFLAQRKDSERDF